MNVTVATCAICDGPICMELPDAATGIDLTRLQQEFEAAAEEHVRTHPKPVREQFWLRCHLDELRPEERALAVKQIYSELLAWWGDQDSRGLYTVNEALGTAAFYRLWLAANRCSYRGCRHAAEPPSDREKPLQGNGNIGWHRELLGRILPPLRWAGTLREWRELSNAVTNNCTCPLAKTRSSHCPAHQLVEDRVSLNRLLFERRMGSRLQREEFDDACVPIAGAQDQAPRQVATGGSEHP